jgi:hypothetical protein
MFDICEPNLRHEGAPSMIILAVVFDPFSGMQNVVLAFAKSR